MRFLRGSFRLILELGIPCLLLLPGCGGAPPAPGPPVAVRVTAGAREVPFGGGFPLEVVRAWDRTLVPREWSDAALSPLVLGEISVERREDAGRIEEIRRFRAHAFRAGRVRVPALRFEAVPVEGGRAVEARAEPFEVTVLPTLDPAAPGEPEWSGDPLPVPAPRWPWVLGAVVALLAGSGLLLGRTRRPAAVPAPPAPPPVDREGAGHRALRRLAALRARTPADGEAVRKDFSEAADIVRDFVGERCGVPARERTREELERDPAVTGGPHAVPAAALGAVLGPADLVKFAKGRPSAEDRTRLLDAARDLVGGGGR